MENHKRKPKKVTFSNVFNLLRQNNLKLIPISPKMRFQKLNRYGEDDSQVLINPKGNLYFQLIKSEKHLLLVTVFSKLSYSFTDLGA
ncbi:hypothetical protein I7104_004680 [Vibrio parahaemolyticus]|nr:hypothetical protein [Vibrio parahaemolyticus]PUZ83941.1 hypothetical protein DC360_17325 [Vibrio vulnificus]HCZ9711310.1 hypothetical protein [Vibrio parahaemolyticus]